MNPIPKPIPEKPHAVFIPFPAQGHITPMLKLAKLLHHRGFFITFVNTEYNHKRLLKSRGPDSLKGLPDFRFETISDGIFQGNKNDDIEKTQHVPSLCESTKRNCLKPLQELLQRLNSSLGVARVTCIVSDGVMSFTLEASEELGIPNLVFWTTSACGFLSYKQCINLMDSGIIPFKDSSFLTNGYMDTEVDWILGKKQIAMKDLPILIRTTNPQDVILNFLKGEIESASRASAIILHTFHELESDVLEALSSNLSPKIYAIGPLQLHLDQIPENKLNSIGSNLWEEEDQCTQWLDMKEPNSVIYVNFGSVRVLKKEEIVELAWGLANSNKNFLWVIRRDLVMGGIKTLPKEFFDETKERGLIASWCAQEEVLHHPSIGGFFTHNGWNSTIESISAGVPMICWPYSSEQRPNCLYVCTEWGIGMAIDGDNLKRNEVAWVVRELMEEEKGKMMKKKAMEWKRVVEEATRPGGSSSLNLENMVDDVLIFQN